MASTIEEPPVDGAEDCANRVSASTKAAGVTIGISRNGLSTSRSLSPLTIRSAWPLTASSRNLSSVGSRQAAMRSVIGTNSAAARSRATPSRNEGIVAATM